MSARERVAWAAGFAVGALLGVLAALYVLPPAAPSILLGALMGVIATTIVGQLVNLILTVRRGRE